MFLFYFYFSSIVMVAWLDEMKVVHHIQYRKDKLVKKYAEFWKHKVDLMFTAQCVVSFVLVCQ